MKVHVRRDSGRAGEAREVGCVLFDWGNTLMVDLPGCFGPMASWPRVEAVAHAQETLGQLRAAGWHIALATNAADSDEDQIRIALARAGHADILAVGNEVLLREDMSEDELLGYIERVRQAVPAGLPVGYVDAYYLFERHPRVTAACDVVLTNCYPFWEGCARDQAIAYMQSMYQRTVAVAAGKKVIISETGWPNTGSAFHGAVPSVDGAMRYFVDTCRWARQDGVEVFYFAAFDEAWKVGAEGDVGAYWGLWDKHGLPKYV